MSFGWSSSCNKVLDQKSMKLKRSMSCEQVTTFQGVDFDRLIVDAPKKLRQPRDVQRDPPRLVLRQHLRLPRFGEHKRLPARIADDVAAGHLVGMSGRGGEGAQGFAHVLAERDEE